MEDTELRKRTTITDEVDSDTGPDTEVISGEAVADAIGQDDNSKLEEALGKLPPRWKNWVIRGVFTWLMIGGFGLIIYGGPLALMLTTLCVQVKCFFEIINIGYQCTEYTTYHGFVPYLGTSWSPQIISFMENL